MLFSLRTDLRLKRTPVLTHGSKFVAGGARPVEHLTLNQARVGSTPAARTVMNHWHHNVIGVVVRTAHPCGGQRVCVCGRSSVVERRVYTPSQREFESLRPHQQMRSPAGEPREPKHGCAADEGRHWFHMPALGRFDSDRSHRQRRVASQPISA